MPKPMSKNKKPRWIRRALSTSYVNWYCLVSLAVFFCSYMILVPMEVDISNALLKLHKAEKLLSEALIKQKLTICSEYRLKNSPAARALCWLDDHREHVEFWVNNIYYYTLYASALLILFTVLYTVSFIICLAQKHHVFETAIFVVKYCITNIIAQLKYIHSIIFFDFELINKTLKEAEREKIKFASQKRKWEKERKSSKSKQVSSMKKICDTLSQLSTTKKELSQMQVKLEEMSAERGDVLERLNNAEKEVGILKTINEEIIKELKITVGVNVMLKAKVYALQGEKSTIEDRMQLMEKEIWSLRVRSKQYEQRASDLWRTRSRFTVQEMVTTKNGRRLGKTGSQTAEVGSDSNFSLYQNESCKTYVGESQQESTGTDETADNPARGVESTSTSVNCGSQSASNWSDETTEDVVVSCEAESVEHCPEFCEQSDCSLCAEFHHNRFPEHCGKNFECFEYTSPSLDQRVFKETQYINCGNDQYPCRSNFVHSHFTTLRHECTCQEYESPSYTTSHYDSTEPEPPSEYECCEFGHRLQSRSLNTSDLVQVTEFNYSHKTLTSEDVTTDETEPNMLRDEQINWKKYMTAANRRWSTHPHNIHQQNLLFLRHLMKGNREYISSSFASDAYETPNDERYSEDSDQGSLRPVTDSAAFRHFLRGLDEVHTRRNAVRRTSDSSLRSASAKRHLSRPDSSTTTRSLSPLSGTSRDRRLTYHKRPRTATNNERGPFQRFWRRY